MRLAGIAAALLLATSAVAADAPAIHQGDMVRDANNVRLGAVNSVNSDGSVGLIYESRYITLPAASLTVVNGKVATSLTKAQVSDLK